MYQDETHTKASSNVLHYSSLFFEELSVVIEHHYFHRLAQLYGISIIKWFSQNMVSQSKNGKLYIFQKKWFVNHYMVFIKWFPLNGFSIIKWFLNH